MTIVTKPLSEKKGDANAELLVDGIKVDIVGDPERGPAHRTGNVRPPAFRALVRERRANAASTACLLFAALIVMSCGITIGLYLYSQLNMFMRAQVEMHKLSCRIPYNALELDDFPPMGALKQHEPYFNEDFEIDNSHEKISVPDFSGGRPSRFVHDFKTNKTGIVDVEGKRCFVMPLNHSIILPPQTLFDLIKKMQEGYYDIDTNVLRDSMRVMTPAIGIEAREGLGVHIKRECEKFPIYRLEKIVSGVYKRSAEPEVKFVEFAGKNMQELHIINYEDLKDHEELLPVAMA